MAARHVSDARYSGATLRELPMHPLSLMFPSMNAAEQRALQESVAAHGVREPVLIWNDHGVIDGRHRTLAAIAVDCNLPVQVWEFDSEDEARALVLARNVTRRHLNESQLAIIAARMTRAGGGRRSRADSGVTREQAASIVGVSVSLVSNAQRVILDEDQTLYERVWAGSLSLALAIRAIRDRERPPRVERAPSIAPMPAYIRPVGESVIETHATELLALSQDDPSAWVRSLMQEQGAVQARDVVMRLDEFIRASLSIMDEEVVPAPVSAQSIGDEADAQAAERVDVVQDSHGRNRSQIRRTPPIADIPEVGAENYARAPQIPVTTQDVVRVIDARLRPRPRARRTRTTEAF